MEITERMAQGVANNLAKNWGAQPETSEQSVENNTTETVESTDTKVEDSVETQETKETQESQQETRAVETNTVNWEERAREYETEINKLKTESGQTFQYANKEIEKLDKLAREGVEINQDFWAMQSLDLEKYNVSEQSDALELVRLELKVGNKEYSDEEVSFLLKRKYPALFDNSIDNEDEAHKDALMALRIDSKAAKTKLAEYKSKIELPKVDIHEIEKQRQLEEEAIANFVNDVKKNVSSYSEQSFKAGDTELKFILDDKSRQLVESSIINNSTFFSDNYVNKENGTVDYGRLQRDLLLIANQDKVFKMFYDQGLSAGKESIVDDLTNAQTPAQEHNPDRGKSIDEQISEQIKGKLLFRR